MSMLFQRRNKLGLSEKIRGSIWPRRGFLRAFRYQGLRMMRLSASPHAVAAGAAAGVFVSCTPFVGFQMLLGVVLALAIGGSILSMVIASWVGNPVTYPLIWATGYHIGTEIMDELPPDVTAPLVSALENPVTPPLGPPLVGMLTVGLVAGVMTYFLVIGALIAWRTRRQRNLLHAAG
jgi:uncharacterized protein